MYKWVSKMQGGDSFCHEIWRVVGEKCFDRKNVNGWVLKEKYGECGD